MPIAWALAYSVLGIQGSRLSVHVCCHQAGHSPGVNSSLVWRAARAPEHRRKNSGRVRLRVAPLHAADKKLLPLAQLVRIHDAQVLFEPVKMSGAGICKADKPS